MKMGNPINCMEDTVVKSFYDMWKSDSGMLGGKWISNADGVKMWTTSKDAGDAGSNLAVTAMQVLDYFYVNSGGIWTGCFKLEKNADCRGALAGNVAN